MVTVPEAIPIRKISPQSEPNSQRRAPLGINCAASSANTTAPTAPVFKLVVLPLSTPSHSKHLHFSPKPPLFTVVRGIDDYESRDFPKLHGAVGDSAEVVDLLLPNYQVHRDQLCFLANKAASRSRIISAPEELSMDPRIRPSTA